MSNNVPTKQNPQAAPQSEETQAAEADQGMAISPSPIQPEHRDGEFIRHHGTQCSRGAGCVSVRVHT